MLSYKLIYYMRLYTDDIKFSNKEITKTEMVNER